MLSLSLSLLLYLLNSLFLFLSSSSLSPPLLTLPLSARTCLFVISIFQSSLLAPTKRLDRAILHIAHRTLAHLQKHHHRNRDFRTKREFAPTPPFFLRLRQISHRYPPNEQPAVFSQIITLYFTHILRPAKHAYSNLRSPSSPDETHRRTSSFDCIKHQSTATGKKRTKKHHHHGRTSAPRPPRVFIKSALDSEHLASKFGFWHSKVILIIGRRLRSARIVSYFAKVPVHLTLSRFVLVTASFPTTTFSVAHSFLPTFLLRRTPLRLAFQLFSSTT
jgi:hypothetical protein